MSEGNKKELNEEELNGVAGGVLKKTTSGNNAASRLNSKTTASKRFASKLAAIFKSGSKNSASRRDPN